MPQSCTERLNGSVRTYSMVNDVKLTIPRWRPHLRAWSGRMGNLTYLCFKGAYIIINCNSWGLLAYIRTMSDFNKQRVNIKWLLSDYNSIAWFCSILSTKIVSNKLTTEPLHISIQTQLCFVYEWNESSESIQLPIPKDSHVLCSWMNQPFEQINWVNDSVIKLVTWCHLMAVLVSFLKYHFSYLNHWIFLYSICYI